MRVIKDIALSEPLVDLVESKAVVTNAAPILTLDIMTCKKEVRFVLYSVFFILDFVCVYVCMYVCIYACILYYIFIVVVVYRFYRTNCTTIVLCIITSRDT